MKFEKFNEVAELVGIVAIVASLVFVGLQLRQSDNSAQAEMSQGQVAVNIELHALVAEHSDVWLRACAGEELSQPERLIANSIYSVWAANNFISWARHESAGIGFVKPSFFTDSFAANYHRYPGFEQMVSSYSDWSELGVRTEDSSILQLYGKEIYDRVVELREVEPNPNADITWCGIR